jgi:hypothetical protein
MVNRHCRNTTRAGATPHLNALVATVTAWRVCNENLANHCWLPAAQR